MNELERMQILAGIKPKSVIQLKTSNLLRKLRFAKWYVIHISVAFLLVFLIKFFAFIRYQEASDYFFSLYEAWCFGHLIPDNAK